MAVSVPAWNAALTESTATCPPKRMVRSRVSSTEAGVRSHKAPSRAVEPDDCGRQRAEHISRLVADRQRHVLGRDGCYQLQHVVVLAVLLDAPVVHFLQRLMVFLAHGHGALGGVEGQPLQGGNEL